MLGITMNSKLDRELEAARTWRENNKLALPNLDLNNPKLTLDNMFQFMQNLQNDLGVKYWEDDYGYMKIAETVFKNYDPIYMMCVEILGDQMKNPELALPENEAPYFKKKLKELKKKLKGVNNG